MKRLSVLFLLPALLLAGFVRADEPRQHTVTVPFELLKSKHIAIKIKINGHGPYRVIFDTGAPVSLINTRTARASGMVAKNAQASFFTLFNSMGPVPIKDLRIGGLDVDGSLAIVMDHPTLDLISRILGPIEGLVGYPFWSRFKLTIDYQTQRMTFTPSGYKPDDPLEAIANAMSDGPIVKVLRPAAQWGLVLDKAAKDETAGVSITRVMPGSAAAAAGLKAGDRLLTLDGRWTDSVADAYQAAAFVKPGETVTVAIRRAGKEHELKVTPQAGM